MDILIYPLIIFGVYIPLCFFTNESVNSGFKTMGMYSYSVLEAGIIKTHLFRGG